MKIKFYGTSHGIPAPDRYCSCIAVEVGGKYYFIDAGAPLMDLLLHDGGHPNDIKAIFTTHRHGDHTSGLFSLCDTCNWAFKESSFTVVVTEEELGKKIADVAAYLETYIDPNESFAYDRMHFVTASEGLVYDDGTVKATYFKTEHMADKKLPSYAVLLEAEGKKLFFTGDLSWMLNKNDFPAYPRENKVDLTVCELAHFGLEQVEPYLADVKTDRFYFNHIWSLDKIDGIKALDASGVLPYKLTVAEDGDVIEL